MKPEARTLNPALEGLLGLLGLGRKGGGALIGVDRIRRELQRGRVHCVVLAEDASSRVQEKIVRLAGARGVPLVTGPTAERLGARLGRPAVMAVGVLDRSLALGIRRALERTS